MVLPRKNRSVGYDSLPAPSKHNITMSMNHQYKIEFANATYESFYVLMHVLKQGSIVMQYSNSEI